MRKKKGGKLGLLIGALLIASAIVAAGVIVGDSSEIKEYTGPNDAIQTGDVLHYNVIGHRDGASVNGAITIIYQHVSEGRSEMSMGITITGDIGYWTITAFGSQIFNPYGDCIGSQWMETLHGDRFVKRLIDYRPEAGNSTGIFRNTYVGVESEIAYRVNASGPGYHLNAELTDTTVDGMYRWDKREGTVRTQWDEMGESSSVFTLYPYHVDGKFLMLHQEGYIRISCDGNGSAVFFMTEGNINNMDHGAPFEFDADLSIPDGKGTRQGLLAPGLYYIICDNTNGSGDSVFWYEIDLR